MQSGTPSPSVSVSVTPQPQNPGTGLVRILGALVGAVVDAILVAVGERAGAAVDDLGAHADTGGARVGSGAGVAVAAGGAVRLVRVRAEAGRGRTDAGNVALVERDAADRVRADAGAAGAAIGLRAGVAVVAGRVVGQRGVRAERIAAGVGRAGVAVVAVRVGGALEAGAGAEGEDGVVADGHVTAGDRAAEDVASACRHVAACDHQCLHLHVVAERDRVGRAADDQPEAGGVPAARQERGAVEAGDVARHAHRRRREHVEVRRGVDRQARELVEATGQVQRAVVVDEDRAVGARRERAGPVDRDADRRGASGDRPRRRLGRRRHVRGHRSGDVVDARREGIRSDLAGRGAVLQHDPRGQHHLALADVRVEAGGQRVGRGGGNADAAARDARAIVEAGIAAREHRELRDGRNRDRQRRLRLGDVVAALRAADRATRERQRGERRQHRATPRLPPPALAAQDNRSPIRNRCTHDASVGSRFTLHAKTLAGAEHEYPMRIECVNCDRCNDTVNVRTTKVPFFVWITVGYRAPGRAPRARAFVCESYPIRRNTGASRRSHGRPRARRSAR